MEGFNSIKRIIKKVDASKLVRHINGNTLDNRLENLALVTALEAFQNKGWTVDAVCTLTDAEFVIWSKARQGWSGDMTIFQK